MGKKKVEAAETNTLAWDDMTESAKLDALKKMDMDALVAQYNSMVPAEEAKTEAQLGSEIKARNAIKKLLGVNFKFERSPKSGIGNFAKDLLLEGHTNAAVLAAVKEQFPEAKTTMGCIGYYRAKLVQTGALTKGSEPAASNDVEEQAAA
jgi:hypothetical protein